MSDYDTDLQIWSKHEAELPRIASRHPAHMAQNEIGPDWLNIAEEIESLGIQQYDAIGPTMSGGCSIATCGPKRRPSSRRR